LGPAWIASAALAPLAVGLAAFLVAAGTAEPLVLAAIAVAVLAAVLALAAAPLALAPGEALRAALASGAPSWGLDRQDFWGGLARDIARLAEPAPPPPDPFLEMRRLAANLELTLRQTGEELALARRSVADAAGAIGDAAGAGSRLAAVAADAERQLADAAGAAASVCDALAALPGHAGLIETAAERTLEAARSVTDAAAEAAALRKPSAEDAALREAVARGAEQARRLEAAMPLLLEGVARLPAAAASEERLSSIADALAGGAASLSDGLARLDGAAERVARAASSIAIPDIAPALDAAAARLEAVRGELVAAGRSAVEAAVTRVCDVAEVVALDAGWRAGDAAASAVGRLEASARALAEDAAGERGRMEDRFAALTGALAAAEADIERRAAEAIARLEVPLAAHEATLGGIAVRLDAASAELAAALADDTARSPAAGLAQEAEALISRLEAAVTTLAKPRAAIAVEGEEPLASVAERLLAELSEEGGDEPVLLGSLDETISETIRRLQSVAGAIAARAAA
jgi:hypothetical protein